MPAEPVAEPIPAEVGTEPRPEAHVGEIELPLPPLSVPEPALAARVSPPGPPRPLPDVRRAIFFDVENASRSEHAARVLDHLRIDRIGCQTELVAVGNWRVVNQDTARLLAVRGAHLVHSAPSVGVRDWSDLRIAVTAGVWLAGARPGDAIAIISDDQAFDAVGDVAASLGVSFQRLSYRALAGIEGALPELAATTAPSRSRRRRRGGRGQYRSGPSAPAMARPVEPMNGGEPDLLEGHTAPHDELLAVARELLESSAERAITLDTLSNALKGRGFRRPPGSPRLITRLRRIKELEVGRNGTIRLVDAGEPPALTGELVDPDEFEGASEVGSPDAGPDDAGDAAGAPGRRRRRRRRGGRGRRRRGGGQATVAAP